MATFDYATPIWADGDAVAATNVQTLGRLAATITNITMSVQSSAAAVLPSRSADSHDYTYGDLLFLQYYVFTHMALMDQDRQAALTANQLTLDHVLVHTAWLRQIADVMETMAHHVMAGRFAYPKIQTNDGEATAQDWANDLQFQASMAAQMASDIEAA
ncbi:hypothetical protein [Gordonia sihwensis]|uniref:hypothetical protein n=1 Tax=Gordonia sihwensis TaxID=173559 RepID=UPI0005EF2F15|nr:hypothetical protein [Gordonia sihwensis]KJR10503.1 hypothetical protein UG54_00455 [Gordonia sihwensis]